MTSAVMRPRVQSFSEMFEEPYMYAGEMFESAFRTQRLATSALQEGAGFCATFLDLASRVLKAIAGVILSMPLVNIVALQIFRFFNMAAFAPINALEVYIPETILNAGALTPEEMDLDEEFQFISNRGEVLIPEDVAPLAEVSAGEFEQRKTDLIQALTTPQIPLELQNFKCTNHIAMFDLDPILARYRTDYPARALELLFEYANVPRPTRLSVHRAFSAYEHSYLSRQGRDAAQSFSRLYDFLIQKKALFQNHPKEDLFKAEIRSIFDKICDAHQNCIDQVRSQLTKIVIATIASYDAARTSQNRTAVLRCTTACALLNHKLDLISEICIKEYPRESHLADLELEVKRLLAGALGLNGQIFEVGAYYSNIIDDMRGKARNVAEIFLHGRPLERYRRADRDYAADQYQSEKFLADGLNLTYGHLRSLGCNLMLWARDYFRLEEEDEQTTTCIELISEDDELTVDIGGNLKPEALLYFLNHLGIFEARAAAAV